MVLEGAYGPECLKLPPALAQGAYSFGESATRRRPVFSDSLHDVICSLTVGVGDAGNVGLRGGGAHDSPSSVPLHVRTDHRGQTLACRNTPALFPLLPPAARLVWDEGCGSQDEGSTRGEVARGGRG